MNRCSAWPSVSGSIVNFLTTKSELPAGVEKDGLVVLFVGYSSQQHDAVKKITP